MAKKEKITLILPIGMCAMRVQIFELQNHFSRKLVDVVLLVFCRFN